MIQPDVTASEHPPQAGPGHEGSAPLILSGRGILASWLISIVAHAVLFLGMVALVLPFNAEKKPDRPAARVEVVGPVEATSFLPSRDFDLSQSASVNDVADVRIPPKPFAPPSDLMVSKKPELTVIGIGAGGGDFTKYGLSVGGGPGPEFFGLGGSARGAREIVYVVDRSGSMIDTFVYVQAELKRSISALRRSQKFHVIFFNAGPPLEYPPKRPVAAIEAHKTEFFKFLETVAPGGGTKPEGAMNRALALEPDLVYLLSDGVGFQQSLHRRLDEWNADRKARIYTIAYLDRAGSQMLEQIAREHDGEFRFVSEEDLP